MQRIHTMLVYYQDCIFNFHAIVQTAIGHTRRSLLEHRVHNPLTHLRESSPRLNTLSETSMDHTEQPRPSRSNNVWQNSLAAPRATIVSTPPHPAICLVRYSVVWILWRGAQAARHRPLLQPLVGQNQDRLVTTTMKQWPRHREVRLIAKLASSWVCPRPSCSLALACTSTGRDARAVVATTRHRSTPLLGTVPACSLMSADTDG